MPAQAVGAAGDLLILAVNQGEPDAELAALGERFTRPLGGAEAIVAELAALEGGGARLGEIDLVDGVHDDAGFPGGLMPVPCTTSVRRRWSWVLVARRPRLRPFLVGGSFDHGVCLRFFICADSITVRTRSRHPLPFASLKATGQTPGA